MRFRHTFLLIGGLLVVVILLLADPDSGLLKNLPTGASTLAVLINLLTGILFIGLLHLARKALFDYIDLEVFFKKALSTSEGAGMALIGVGLAMVAIAITVLAATV